MSVMTREAKADLKSKEVADLLGLSQDTVSRIPKAVLDYWQTPGGGVLRHRRYRREDVERYAREVLGRDLGRGPTEP